jgi:hypothetical protein
MNLIGNAVESISGQGEVAIRTENRYLDTPVGYAEVEEGKYVILRVSDTGKGSPPSTSKRSSNLSTRRRSWGAAAPVSVLPSSGAPSRIIRDISTF